MSKEDRMKNASEKKKGRNIVLLAADGDSYGIVASETEGMRTRADVKDWMKENDFLGTVFPCRMDTSITRSKQETIGFSEGEAPVVEEDDKGDETTE